MERSILIDSKMNVKRFLIGFEFATFGIWSQKSKVYAN